jgi:hypothetical protein
VRLPVHHETKFKLKLQISKRASGKQVSKQNQYTPRILVLQPTFKGNHAILCQFLHLLDNAPRCGTVG